MPPFFSPLFPRHEPGISFAQLSSQWSNPSDVFSILLILGGDVVGRALAQLAGGWVTPVAFSFGWVAYSITAVLSIIGDGKIMPAVDCACKVINGKTGFSKDNTNWVIGRIVRDYENWMNPEIRKHVASMIEKKAMERNKAAAGPNAKLEKPTQAGLCVSFYTMDDRGAGRPGHDRVYYSGLAVMFGQLGIAAIPGGLYENWGILLVTVFGVILSFITGSVPQWASEKWACRKLHPGSQKRVVLTRGNGSQHAIVVLSNGSGLDLEDLASGSTNLDVSTRFGTRIIFTILALLWILLLITAAGITTNTWFLLAVGGIGISQNIWVAGARRSPPALGVPLVYTNVVIGETKVMQILYAVDRKYKGLGRSMRETFFPGAFLTAEEEKEWEALAERPESQKI